jgi:hypothetical protein
VTRDDRTSYPADLVSKFPVIAPGVEKALIHKRHDDQAQREGHQDGREQGTANTDARPGFACVCTAEIRYPEATEPPCSRTGACPTLWSGRAMLNHVDGASV